VIQAVVALIIGVHIEFVPHIKGDVMQVVPQCVAPQNNGDNTEVVPHIVGNTPQVVPQDIGVVMQVDALTNGVQTDVLPHNKGDITLVLPHHTGLTPQVVPDIKGEERQDVPQ
jgi:hypothetical protein